MDVIVPILVALFIILGPTIGRILAKAQEEQARRMRQGGAPQGQGQPKPAAKSLQDEIGKFLRRVAEQQQPRQPPQGKKARAAQRKAAQAAPQAEPVPAEAIGSRPVGGQVTEHVRKHLDSSKFQRRSQQMGGEVAQADEKFEQRLQGAFDHKLGSLSTSAGAASSDVIQPAGLIPGGAPVALPADIAALFATPESLRQAIIINEVLQRPVHRW
jgi:hypothetical protein